MKKPWMSKTLWVNLLMAGVAFFPSVQAHVTAEQAMAAMGVINILLRFISKDAISLS